MANDANNFDLGTIVSSSLKANPADATGSTSVSVRGSSAPDVDALTRILQTATGAIAAEGAKQKLIADTESQIAKTRVENLTAAATTIAGTSDAEARAAKAKIEADYRSQLENAALTSASGLSLDSVLGKSIKEINARTDSYIANVEKAKDQNDKTIGAMLRGTTSFSEWLDAKLVHPVSMYTEQAAEDATVMDAEIKRIQSLQSLVSGQTAVNKATQVSLYQGAAADAASVAAAKTVKEASALQEQALAVGASYAQSVMSQSVHKQATAHSMGTLAVGVENAKRQWAAFDAKDTDPQILAGYVRVAMKTLGRPDADMYTAKYVEEFKKMNPKNGAMIATLANTGMMLAGHQAITPNEPLPAALGAPSEAYAIISATGGKLPAGSEQFQSRLMSLAAAVEADETLKPDQRSARLDNSSVQWINTVVDNVDSSEYGKPVLPAIISMASMNTPEVVQFTESVLKPLAAAGNVVDAEVLMAAVKAADIPEPVKIAGLQAYANSASAQVDATRRPQLLGFPTAASLPYTASVSTGSLFGGKMRVNLKDEKSIRDYLFKSELYKKAKTGSLTLIDAAAATIVAGRETPK